MNRLPELVEAMLKEIGVDPGREGLRGTPERVARAFGFFTQGYAEDPSEILNGAIFEESYNEMLVVKDIDFYSLCEHHLLPFFGRAHVAYVPDGRIVGLSKICRLVETFSRRLQVQERLTNEIAKVIELVLQPEGSRRRVGGPAPVHDDAGRPEAELLRHHKCHAGGAGKRPQDPKRVHAAP